MCNWLNFIDYIYTRPINIQALRGYLAPLVTAFGASWAHFPQVALKLLSRYARNENLSRVASYCVSHSTWGGENEVPTGSKT
jgi:hypothetical protein